MKVFYKISKFILIFSIIVAWTFNFPPTPFLKNFGGQGWPPIWQNPRIPPETPKVLAATETIRPTDAYSQESWTTPSNAYDGNTNTSGSYSNVNKAPSISFGGASTGETTNAWQSKAQTWSSATLYLTFSKTAGSNDTVEVLITDQNGTLKHTIVSSTAGAVTKQEFSQVLNSADWGGSGFPNIANLRVRVNGSKSGGPDGATSYMYDIRIDGEYTSPIYSVAITPGGTIAYGNVEGGQSKSTIDISATQTATNDGNTTENLNIKTSKAIDGTEWAVGSSAGANVFVHEFSTNSGGDWTKFDNDVDYKPLATGVAQSGTVDFDLRITVPTDSDSTQKNITITVQAVAP